MYIQQSQSILFYIRLNKKDKKGNVPVYARLSVDGQKRERAVKGVKILPEHWDNENKLVKPDAPNAKNFNKKIAQVQTDLGRHFDLAQAKKGVATAVEVIEAYDSPIHAVQIKLQKAKNLEFSERLDEIIAKYVKYSNRYFAAHEFGQAPHPTKAYLLAQQKEELKKELDGITLTANAIFDDKNWEKTFILAINEKLLHFLQLAFSGNRSPNTLEKIWGKKRRYIEFLQYRYKCIDVPLSQLELKILDQLLTYNMTQHGTIKNSAMKYVQTALEIIDRCVANGWIPGDIFQTYTCSYDKVKHDWLTPAELLSMMEMEFPERKYNIVRDIYIFSSYTGLSYAEIRSLSPGDIITGIDGKSWVSKDRQKTEGDETLPLLPIPLFLIDKYKGNPVCIKRNKLLPVPCNVEYNRCLKEIARRLGIKIVLRTHKARFYFANEVLFNNGVQLKTIARMMGQKSIKSAEIYVRANRTAISESMQGVEEKLFNPDGSLKSKNQPQKTEAKIISMKVVP